MDTKAIKNTDSLNYIHEGSVFIFGEFDDTIMRHVVPYLGDIIEEKSKEKDSTLKIHIASSGGYLYTLRELLRLVETAKSKDVIVETYVADYAYSCGSLLAVAGSKGHRYIGEDGEHLIHYGSAGGYRAYTPLQAERIKGATDRHFKSIVKHYKKYASVPDLNEIIKDDLLFIPAKKCIAWGLADEIL